jgi:hypothetical protein
MIDCKNLIIKFYNDTLCAKPYSASHFVDLAVMGNRGLGDCVILTNLIKCAREQNRVLDIFCPSRHFNDICSRMPNYTLPEKLFESYTQVEFFEQYNYGNGHIIQKMQRAMGFTPEIKPKGYLITSPERKKRICLHLNTGPSAFELESKYPRPRQLYKENIPIVQNFVNAFKNEYEFVELGGPSLQLENVNNQCDLSIAASIDILRESEYFIGLNSGFMNVAAALDVKSIVITNIPNPAQLYLPMLNDAPIHDMTWLYPQNVHVSQDGENPLVPQLSLESLSRAINGEVYPYWSNDYLNLINEF